MGFTRGWNDGTPAGTRAAAQIDDAIREFKVDLHERMDSVFVNDWTADPLVVKDAILGKVTGRNMVFGPHMFQAKNTLGFVDHEDGYVEMGVSGQTLVASPRLPGGITITKLEAVMDKGSAANCALAILKYNYVTGALIGTLDTATRILGGIALQAGAGGVLAEPVDSASQIIYVFRFTAAAFGGTGPRLYGVRLTYDIPGSQSAS